MEFDQIILCTSAPEGQGLGYYYYRALCDIIGQEKVGIVDEGRRNYGAGIVTRGIRRAKNLIGHLSILKYKAVLSRLTPGRNIVVVLFNNSDLRPAEIKNLAADPSVYLINYLSDSPFGMPPKQRSEVFDCLRYFEFVFTFAEALVPVLYQMGAKKVSRIPFAYCRYTHLEPVKNIVRDRTNSLVYFGTWTPVIEKWLDHLIGFELVIEGNGWHNASNPVLRKIGTKKRPNTDHNMAIMARRAGLVVNFTRAAHGCFHTMKTFELTITGACVVSNYSNEQNEFFTDNRSMVYFNTPEEMVTKIKNLFGAPSDIERIGNQAALDAMPFSYHTRASQLIELIERA